MMKWCVVEGHIVRVKGTTSEIWSEFERYLQKYSWQHIASEHNTLLALSLATFSSDINGNGASIADWIAVCH